MAIEKWSDIIPSVAKVPFTAYKHRHTIQKWWKHAQAYLNKGNTNIVVLGRPNVGKSVMAAYLYGETKNLSWDLPDTSTDVEIKALTLEKWTKLVRVIPGQKNPNRDKGVEEALNTHNALEGIIYVVDYGFTDEKKPFIKQKMIDGEKIDSVEKARAENLENELKDFENICEQIRKSFSIGKSPEWLLIVANKADLFFDKLDEVQTYYQPKGDSKFSDILNEMLAEVGRQNLKCEVVPLCSYERNFEWNGEEVETKIGGETNRKNLAKHFFKTISNF